MARTLTIGLVVLATVVFGWEIPLMRLFAALQPLTLVLSIMIAAILVRLNRGMPTLDWKSEVDPIHWTGNGVS